jgi:hypothetical protein
VICHTLYEAYEAIQYHKFIKYSIKILNDTICIILQHKSHMLNILTIFSGVTFFILTAGSASGEDLYTMLLAMNWRTKIGEDRNAPWCKKRLKADDCVLHAKRFASACFGFVPIT